MESCDIHDVPNSPVDKYQDQGIHVNESEHALSLSHQNSGKPERLIIQENSFPDSGELQNT